jgi:vacuolar-type H+-ATPase subunit D/Vma8
MSSKTEQEQFNEMLVSTKIKLAPAKRMKELLQKAKNESYDPIESAMRDHPTLTRELAEEMAKAFGF